MSQYTGTVTSLEEGPKGLYAITSTSQARGSVTFSLADAWDEDAPPEKGQRVVLEDLVRKGKGWRAKKARPLRPEDE